MRTKPKIAKRKPDIFEGYPRWLKEARVERLKACFAVIPLNTIIAVCGTNAAVKVAVALHCQATMQGHKKKIMPYAAWRQVLNLSKRAYFRAIATLEKRLLLRRHRRGSGRKAVIELLGPLAQFVKSEGGSQGKRAGHRIRRPKPLPTMKSGITSQDQRTHEPYDLSLERLCGWSRLCAGGHTGRTEVPDALVAPPENA